MEFIMKKILTQQFLGAIGILTSMILSLTLYAYKSDQETQEKQIHREIQERKEQGTQISTYFESRILEHEKLDQAIRKEQKERDDMLIKYLDQRFDDMEKLMKN